MSRRAFALCLSACLAVVPAAAQAQKTPAKTAETGKANEDPIVAKVNGTVLHRSDLLALQSLQPPQLRQQPLEKVYQPLLEQLVAMTLVAQAAKKAKLGEDPRAKKLLELHEDEILQDLYFEGVFKKEITEQKLKARYQEYLKTSGPQQEVKARHILVPSEAEAKEIIEQLKKGADFATLAKEKTTDPAGKASGGDLGWFTEKDMVPEFAHAAFALKKGEVTPKPVKTQFGWHVIKLEDRRETKPPTYEQMAPRLTQEMMQEIGNARIKQLADASKIEVFKPDGSPVAAVAAPPPAASAPGAEAPTGEGLPELPATAPKLSPATAPDQLGKPN